MRRIKIHRDIARKLCVGGLVSAMLIGSLTGCSGDTKEDTVYTQEEASSTQAMVIGDYDINMDELMVYAIQEIVTYGLKPNTVVKDEETYKDQTLALIRETKILYDVALHNDVELGESDLETRDKIIDNFKKAVPQEIFDKYGISDEIITKVFTERTYVEKFENDIKNQMGQDISDDLAEAYKDYNFQTLYYMVFPTVEVTDANEPATDEDGNYVVLDENQKADMKAQAESALKEIRAGEDPEAVAEKYGVKDYCTDTSGYVGAYSDEMNEILGSLKAGECTDVTEGDTGFIIIYVKTDHDEDLRDSYVLAVANDYLDSEYENLRNGWLASIPVDTEADMRGDAWEKFSLEEMAGDLVEAGLVQ